MLNKILEQTDISKVTVSITDRLNNYLVWIRAGKERYRMSQPLFVSLFRFHFTCYVVSRSWLEVAMENICSFGITGSAFDNYNYLTFPGDNWDLARIVIDTNNTYFRVDGATQQL